MTAFVFNRSSEANMNRVAPWVDLKAFREVLIRRCKGVMDDPTRTIHDQYREGFAAFESKERATLPDLTVFRNEIARTMTELYRDQRSDPYWRDAITVMRRYFFNSGYWETEGA